MGRINNTVLAVGDLIKCSYGTKSVPIEADGIPVILDKGGRAVLSQNTIPKGLKDEKAGYFGMCKSGHERVKVIGGLCYPKMVTTGWLDTNPNVSAGGNTVYHNQSWLPCLCRGKIISDDSTREYSGWSDEELDAKKFPKLTMLGMSELDLKELIENMTEQDYIFYDNMTYLYSANMKRDVSLDDIFSALYVLKKEEENQWAEKLVRLGFEGDCTGKKIKKDELYSIIVALTAAENGKNFMETGDGEEVSRAVQKQRELAEKLDEITTVVIAGMQLKKWVEDRLGRRNGNGIYPEVGDPGEPPELDGAEENEWLIEDGELEVESGEGGLVKEGLGKISGNTYNVTKQELSDLKDHISQNGFTSPENTAMIDRLETALENGQSITGADASFYLHELKEASLMQGGMSYDEAHQSALEFYEVSPYSIYDPSVIKDNPDMFNSNWFKFWE